MSGVRLIVFDLDGTLIDSRRDLARAANEVLARREHGPLAEDAVTRMVGEGARVLLERAFLASGLPPPAGDDLDEFNRQYHAHLVDSTRPYEGVDALLREASRRCATALLTNKPEPHAARLVAHFGWSPLLPALVGGDGPHPRKPAAEGLRALMAQAGASPAETVMMGDSHVDLATARAADVRFAFARYGFGAPSVAPASLAEGDWILDAPGDLVRCLAS
jgi:phosphoglycolate phosphatase